MRAAARPGTATRERVDSAGEAGRTVEIHLLGKAVLAGVFRPD